MNNLDANEQHSARQARLRQDSARDLDEHRGAEWLSALYSDSVTAKIWGVSRQLSTKAVPPLEYPEYTRPGGTTYVCSGHDFWTSGFFPGCLSMLYERKTRFPQASNDILRAADLRSATRWWTANLHAQAHRRDTHDLGFMIQPWAQVGWEMDGDLRCFQSLCSAACSLASRFNSTVGCIRSWDRCETKIYDYQDPQTAFLVIIDNMMNLDLLYYVAHYTGERHLADVATAHALTTMKSHIRADDSTYHVVNFDQRTGDIIARFTNQGMSDTSCWSRGQAWGIAGFAQAYGWTKRQEFLVTAVNLSKKFMEQLPADGVPPWDFSDPAAYDFNKACPKDASAGLVAAYGMLLLHEALGLPNGVKDDDQYLRSAIRIIKSTVRECLAPQARMSNDGANVDFGGGLETILDHSTINNFEHAPRRWANHGLVYADYFFLKIGNKLLEMGIVPTL